MATNFASRYKKDLSTETLRTKIVRRKSILQKESRHKEFNKGRQFGLVDVNIQPSRRRELPLLEETGEGRVLKNKPGPSRIPNPVAKTREQERLEMLQRFKAEKELRKLKEQREKPVFKCGRVKADTPLFLSSASQIPVPSKSKDKEVPPPLRITRSKAKSQLAEPLKLPVRAQLSAASNASRASTLRSAQPKQKPIYVDPPVSKDNKAGHSTVTTNGRALRATTARVTKIPLRTQPAGNLPQKKAANKGKQQKESKEARALSDIKENISIELVEEELKPEILTVADSETNRPILGQGKQPEHHVPDPAPQRRTRSFAPQNFVFQPLEGLATYKVKPMSPSRVDVFFSPDLAWNPTEATKRVPEEDGKENVSQDCGPKHQLPSGSEVTEENLPEHQPSVELMDVNTECTSGERMEVVSADRELNTPGEDLPVAETPSTASNQKPNVAYFRNILESETKRLTTRCLEWDGAAEADIPEDAKDLIRTTVGQTRLLISERFKQFRGLVDNCEFRRGEKETTCTDLEGFWDMVNFQVQDVNKKFENLKKLQGNGWEMLDDVVPKKPLSKRRVVPQRATKAVSGSAERAAARKRLAAIKAAMKNMRKEPELEAEPGAPDIPAETEKITFDGGFFKIESPARPFPGQTPKPASGTSRRVSRRMTPRSASRDLLQSCADTCIIRQGTPMTSNPLPPLPDLDVSLGPAGADLLSCVSEESGLHTDENPCTAATHVEETAEVQSAIFDRGTPLRGGNGLKPQGLHSPTISSTEEEAEQTVTEMGEQEVPPSPKEDIQLEGTCSVAEEPPIPACEIGTVLGDSFCDSRALRFQPNRHSCLLLTPVKKETEKFTASPASNDLIVFSPISSSHEEK